MLNYGLDGRGVERTDWGVIDGEEHLLTLYLDSGLYISQVLVCQKVQTVVFLCG